MYGEDCFFGVVIIFTGIVSYVIFVDDNIVEMCIRKIGNFILANTTLNQRNYSNEYSKFVISYLRFYTPSILRSF